MRLLTTLFVTASLSLLWVHAIHPHALSHRGHNHHAAAAAHPTRTKELRQHRIARALVDICVNAKVGALTDLSKLVGLLGLGPLSAIADVQLCLCIKDLDIYLRNSDSVLVNELGGPEIAKIFLEALINDSPESRRCTLPANAHRTCDSTDPCHFTCDPPYQLVNGACVCAPPNALCNGQCGTKGCPSSLPRARSPVEDAGVTPFEAAQSTCGAHETVCGVQSSSDAGAFECLNTGTATHNCGGCVIPNPFTKNDLPGQDCSKLLHAVDTTCANSKCVVKRCDDGWEPSAFGGSCTQTSSRHFKRGLLKDSGADNLLDVAKSLLSKLDGIARRQVLSPQIITDIYKIIHLSSELSNPVLLPSMAHTLDSIPSSTTGAPPSSAYLNSVIELVQRLSDTHDTEDIADVINHLLDAVSVLLGAWDSCKCADKYDVEDFIQALEEIWEAALDVKTGFNEGNNDGHDVPPAFSRTTIPAPTSTTSSLLDLNVTIDSDHWNEIDGDRSGFERAHSDSLLGGLGDENIVANATVGTDILSILAPGTLAKVDLVVDLVSVLGNLTAALLPVVGAVDGTLSSLGVSVDGILDLVTKLLHAPLITGLLDLVDELLVAVGLLANNVHGCTCADDLRLKPLMKQVDKLISGLLDLKTYTQNSPIPSLTTPTTSPSSSSSSSECPLIPNCGDQLVKLGVLTDVLGDLGLSVNGSLLRLHI